MKNLWIILLTIVPVLVFSACFGGTDNDSAPDCSSTVAEEATAVDETQEILSPSPTEGETTASIGPGRYLQRDNLRFTFEKAALYSEITGENGSKDDRPEEGKQYLVCFFEVKSLSSEDNYVSGAYAQAYLDGSSIPAALLFNKVDGYANLSGELAAGKTMKGLLCYEVGTDWQKLEVVYSDSLADDQKYRFIVTPDDISD